MGEPFVWTGTKLLSSLRDTIGDPSGAALPRWEDAALVDYLNRAGQQVVLDTEIILETQWETTLTADQKEYEMPANFTKDRRVEWEKSTDDIRVLHHLTLEDYHNWYSRDPTATGAPQYYYFWRKLGDDLTSVQPTSIFIVPTPGLDEDGDTIRVWGYKVPDAIDVDELSLVVEFEGPYCEALIMWAAHLVKLDDDDGPGAERLEARYMRQRDKILDHSLRRTRSNRPRIRPRKSTLWPDWVKPVLPWQRGW